MGFFIISLLYFPVILSEATGDQQFGKLFTSHAKKNETILPNVIFRLHRCETEEPKLQTAIIMNKRLYDSKESLSKVTQLFRAPYVTVRVRAPTNLGPISEATFLCVKSVCERERESREVKIDESQKYTLFVLW